MDFLPYYVLAGIAVGFVVVLVLENLRLALQYLVIVGKVFVILFLVTLVGWAVGWWEMPPMIVRRFFGLRRLWEPFQENVLQWIGSHLP
jgi:hypothetical protein